MQKSFLKATLAALAISVFNVVPANSQNLAGPYLAATISNYDGDFRAAAEFYTQAMRADPQNVFLKQNAIVSFVSYGDFDSGLEIAKEIHQSSGANPFADLVTLVSLANQNDFTNAINYLPGPETGLSPLLHGMLKGWLLIGSGEKEAAIAVFDTMNDTESIEVFGQYHKGMALAYAGDFEASAEILSGTGGGPLHMNIGSAIAHAQVLSQIGRNDEAVEVLDDFFFAGFDDLDIIALRNDLEAGKTVEFNQITGPEYGISEAFLTMAEALSRDGPSRVALFYARLAQVLHPDDEEVALVLASILEKEGQFELASEAYASVPKGSPSYRAAQIGRAEAMRLAGSAETSITILEELAAAYPKDVDVLNALGDIYRGEERYADAKVAYTRTIENLPDETQNHWVVYYLRGICYERLDDWPSAEADFRHALELWPDHPLVLNYLGYSMVEMQINLAEAQAMIETAVQARPNDGYITDSLAWVLYRLGKFEEAVPFMERAAELLPLDPIVNDHLGDVLWMVGRKMEARFQWKRALSLDPAEEDAIRIKRKLEVGLDVVLEEEAGN